jgi:hypothetical protein
MEISKTKLAAGDTSELLKLARSIKSSKPRDRNANPLASQFFDADPSNVRPLDTAELVDSLAGSVFNEKVQQVEDLVFQQKVREQYPALGSVSKPSVGGDATRIGAGSGWTPPKEISVVSAKAAGLDAALRKNRVAKGLPATTGNADTGVLTALLAEIVKALLGVDPATLDSSTVKTRFTTALKKAGAQVQSQVQSLTDAIEEAKMKSSFVSAGGKWARDGSRLSLSV